MVLLVAGLSVVLSLADSGSGSSDFACDLAQHFEERAQTSEWEQHMDNVNHSYLFLNHLLSQILNPSCTQTSAQSSDDVNVHYIIQKFGVDNIKKKGNVFERITSVTNAASN